MSEYSRELHYELLGYRAFETRLNDRRVDRLEVDAVSTIDSDSVRIVKTGNLEPSDIGLENPPLLVTDYLVTITETNCNPKSNREAIVKETDYLVTAEGEFSEPKQRYRFYPANKIDNIYVVRELSRLIGELTKKLYSQENMDANPEEIMHTKFHLNNANAELRTLVDNERLFSSRAFEYDDDEHKRLLKKLGSLLLY